MRNAPAAHTFAANRAVGRIALAVRANAGVTRRLRVAEEGSLRVRCPGPPAAELEAVIVNTAGGVAGGDRLKLAVTVEPGARLVVTTAAAEKVYRTLEPDATVDVTLTVGAGGALAWLPQETILFDRARLKRSIDIDLAEDAHLVLAEAIVLGRAGMGEAVDDSRLLRSLAPAPRRHAHPCRSRATRWRRCGEARAARGRKGRHRARNRAGGAGG